MQSFKITHLLETFTTQVKNLNHLNQLHAQLIHHSHHCQPKVLTFLLSQCHSVGASARYARLLFNSAPHPNVALFIAMFKFYSKTSAHQEVIKLYCEMGCHNLRPGASVLVILIRSLKNYAVLGHAHVVRLGFESDRYVRNAIMSSYAKHGLVEPARKLFDEMLERGVADWNSMISGYWMWGCKEEAFRLFNSMPEHNVISWTVMVSGLSRIGEMQEAKRIFDAMPERSVVSWNAMLSGYVQNGLGEECLDLFDRMRDSGVGPNETTWVNVISACSQKGDLVLAESMVGCLMDKQKHLNCYVKTALVDMYAKCGNLVKAREIFDQMKSRSVVSWNAMIFSYAKGGNVSAARELFNMMPTKDVASWNSMISGYAQNGQWALALELFKEMATTNDMKPDEVTMSSVISACGHLGLLQYGRWVVDFIAESQTSLSISGQNSLVFMYSRCGSMEDAKMVFQKMLKRDIISYNSLISGLAASGNGLETLGLLKKMESERIEPDSVTYIGVLTACSHAGLIEEGRRVFEIIEKPTVDHYACMVDLLGRAGQMQEAEELISGMKVKPHAGVFGALLNAARINKQVDLGDFAGQKLFGLEPENAGNYVLLSNIYASAGRWQDAERVRKLMRERGVGKMAGYSWIEFNGKIHRFIAGDRSHPRSPDIDKLLEGLQKKMRALGYTANKSCVLRDVEDEEKEEMVRTHSEKLAIAFGLLVLDARVAIRVAKNLRICEDCHAAIKMISKLEGREIVVRDNNRFHWFKDGRCSCKEYW